MINIIVNGAKGRLGQVACQALKASADFNLVAELGRQDNLAATIKLKQAAIVVDTTLKECVYHNTKAIIEAGVRPVIGTSGLTIAQITDLQQLCKEKKLGGIIAPNFALGAVLMMRFAKQAAHYFNFAEIIELHHEKKQDAPSGTALKTAELINSIRTNESTACQETLPGALGAKHQHVAIHSIRLPGLIAHQEVIFGNLGETLTIRHDTTDRSCFAAGIILACRKVLALDQLIYGLENIIE
ncbi:MAG: 4-hydroxy-tetrahydrodipicolinate reductase [Gammaproteobacteria bacterium RIFCSPHIGHO2_12_FULL_35_23]|nr:MAG: 4-hydroxy-tetrahydrodipicolinate reductase [Gammaproteobacteria bacterium RIFCSPHIGHO2_12_FULL_35_23]